MLLFRLCFFLTIFFLICQPAQACSYYPRTMQEYITAANVTFAGKIQSINAPSPNGRGSTARFLVLSSIKGVLKPGEEIEISTSDSSCGIRFDTGEVWFVLSSEKDGSYTADQVNGSLLLRGSRGLDLRANWEAILPLLTDRQKSDLAMSDKCTAARFALMDFFETLPKSCASDADCTVNFYDPQPCSDPIVTNTSGTLDDSSPQTKELLSLQGAIRDNCLLNQDLIPLCSPPVVSTKCAGGMCIK